MKLPSPNQVLTWIKNNFSDYKIKRDGAELIMPNPFGDSGKHFSVTLKPKTIRRGSIEIKGYWVHDWRPNYSYYNGSFMKFVQLYLNCSYRQAWKEVTNTAPSLSDYSEEEEIEKPTVYVELPQSTSIQENNSKIAMPAIRYLGKRNITIPLAIKFGLRCTITTIIFPYYEFGDVVYWQSRSILNKIFKFPPIEVGVGKGDFLYGFDQIEPRTFVIIVESPIDAIGIQNDAVATGGDSITNNQVKRLKILNPNKIILAPDNDEAGVASLRNHFYLLKKYGFNLSYCLPPKPPNKEKMDWNDLLKERDPHQYILDNNKPLSRSSLFNL